ncbi:hypothetical protein K431DRAFT_112268 [Polychaeton citri CBS 116435]|uniref:Uncharacterized protein n=1 Tax=Polychaeton citri CBS 116435 TaxID=1314669 RepID=A0A9P4UNJ8_9PEZI|nr:hypothetical protein K431DRAFT_112268 [Polychaeton citri CBS 116435]
MRQSRGQKQNGPPAQRRLDRTSLRGASVLLFRSHQGGEREMACVCHYGVEVISGRRHVALHRPACFTTAVFCVGLSVCESCALHHLWLCMEERHVATPHSDVGLRRSCWRRSRWLRWCPPYRAAGGCAVQSIRTRPGRGPTVTSSRASAAGGESIKPHSAGQRWSKSQAPSRDQTAERREQTTGRKITAPLTCPHHSPAAIRTITHCYALCAPPLLDLPTHPPLPPSSIPPYALPYRPARRLPPPTTSLP